jgi:glyoxylase-like metal-dependent hydrolase (beta-lactamase superfamily II)
MSCREIAQGVFLIDTRAGGIPGRVACYLVKGEKAALVDAGHATSAGSVISSLQSIDAARPQVDYLIPTHVHLDHAGAVGHLAKAMPTAQVLVDERGAKHVIDPVRLIQHQERFWGQQSLSVFGTPIGVPRERVTPVEGRHQVELGSDKRLTLLRTPGHAPHHLSVLIEDERLLITGDAVGLRYPEFDVPIPVTPPPSFDERQFLESLTQIMVLKPDGLLLPHFGPKFENVDEFVRSSLQTVRRWGSRIFEQVQTGEPLNAVFEFLISDIAETAGKPRNEVPDHIARMIMFSAMGYYSYAQGVLNKS